MTDKKQRYIQQKTEFIDILNHVNFWMGRKKIINILISGPPGIGKTFLCEKIAEELGCTYDDFAGHPGLTREDLEGVPDIQNGNSSWRNGLIPERIIAANRDKIAICGGHEFNRIRPEIQPSLNSLLDYQSKFSCTTNANLTFSINQGSTLVNIFTINENIHGVFQLEKSVKSRFHFKINLKYPSINVEKKVLVMKTDVSEKHAEILSKFCREMRNAAKQDKLSDEISTREIIEFIDTMKVPGISHETAFEYAIKNKIAEDDEESKLIDDLAKNFGLFQQISDITFGTTSNPTEEIKNPEIVNEEKLTVQKYRSYVLKELPKVITFDGNDYPLYKKGVKIPFNVPVAKIYGEKKYIEIHTRFSTGEKKVIKTNSKIIIDPIQYEALKSKFKI